MKVVLTAVGMLGILYCCFAFYFLSFNPHNWLGGARFMYASAVVVGAWISLAITRLEKS